MTTQWIIGLASAVLLLTAIGAVVGWIRARKALARLEGAQAQALATRLHQDRIEKALRDSEDLTRTKAAAARDSASDEHAQRKAEILAALGRAGKSVSSEELEAKVKRALDQAQAVKDKLTGGEV